MQIQFLTEHLTQNKAVTSVPIKDLTSPSYGMVLRHTQGQSTFLAYPGRCAVLQHTWVKIYNGYTNQ